MDGVERISSQMNGSFPSSTRLWQMNSSVWTPNISSWVPDPMWSTEQSTIYHNVQHALDRYMTTAFCAFGCLGNLVTLIVLTRARYLKAEAMAETGAHVGLLALALSDLLFCVALLPRGVIEHTTSLFADCGFLLYYQAYGTGVVVQFILTSTWITVCMATLRYLAICHPLRLRVLDGQRFAKVAYVCVFVICALVNLPTFWQYKITHLELNHTRLYLLDIGYMDLATDHGLAYQWIKAAICFIGPALLLIYFNLSLIAALRRSNQMRRQCYVTQTTSPSRNRITLTLVVIVSAFVILVFPSELLDFFGQCIKMNASRTEVYLIVRSVANLLQVMNFSSNCVLYCFINANFRATVCNMVRCKKRTSSNLSRNFYSTSSRSSPNAYLMRERVISYKTSTAYL